MNWDAEVDVIVVGGGGAGLVAALTAAEADLEVAIFEKTEFLLGNTAASAGMIPACETRFQKDLNITDTVEIMTEDILKKNHYESDRKQVEAVTKISGSLIEWMNDTLEIEMSVVTEFKYPGHSNFRMHAPPSRSGLELMKKLKRQVQEKDNIHLLLQSSLEEIVVDESGAVIGIKIQTNSEEQYIKGEKVILATNGFGGNKELVTKYIPDIADALYFGYEANTGQGMLAAEKVGAAMKSLTAYQGHAAVNESTGLLVTWGTIMMGGFYINTEGKRFGNEPQGYSEFAREVLKQPNGYGYIIYNEKIHKELLSIEDYKQITEMEAFKKAQTIEELAQLIQVNSANLVATYNEFNAQVDGIVDAFNRISFAQKLEGELYAIKVSPALFHTQGGILINPQAQVIDESGDVIPNLFAAGGSAVGVSGHYDYGYMSGNGLLTALGFGRIAGLCVVEQLQKI